MGGGGAGRPNQPINHSVAGRYGDLFNQLFRLPTSPKKTKKTEMMLFRRKLKEGGGVLSRSRGGSDDLSVRCGNWCTSYSFPRSPCSRRVANGIIRLARIITTTVIINSVYYYICFVLFSLFSEDTATVLLILYCTQVRGHIEDETVWHVIK